MSNEDKPTRPAPTSKALVPRLSDEYATAIVEYVRKGRASSTRAAYKEDWGRFVIWCKDGGWQSQPAEPETIAAYAIYLARDRGHSVRYLRRAMAAIGWAHTAVGIDPPPTHHKAVKAVLEGVIREHGKPPNKRDALSFQDLLRLLSQCPADTLTGKRDRALLTLGYFAALRRSELVALDRKDVREIDGGLRVVLQRSKTDQKGDGDTKGVKERKDEADPVKLLREWLAASEIKKGPLFRPINRHDQLSEKRLTGRSVALIIKRTCKRAGLDPDNYSGHSLRRGFATSAARGGADGLIIRKTTKHKSDRMVNEYVDEGTLLGRHAQDYIGIKDDDTNKMR
ncbi:MAG: site-specific integrase [Candidatus Aenigmarchaeota archaeon]|nr:site-specific integrase [Candidatus Aenigmarchaeota archaeon]